MLPPPSPSLGRWSCWSLPSPAMDCWSSPWLAGHGVLDLPMALATELLELGIPGHGLLEFVRE